MAMTDTPPMGQMGDGNDPSQALAQQVMNELAKLPPQAQQMVAQALPTLGRLMQIELGESATPPAGQAPGQALGLDRRATPLIPA